MRETSETRKVTISKLSSSNPSPTLTSSSQGVRSLRQASLNHSNFWGNFWPWISASFAWS